jgi:hypothetical protein
MVVEQTTAIADQAIAMLGGLREWLDNEWIRLVACDPPSRASYLYSSQGWKVAEPAAVRQVPVASCSEKIIVGQTRTIPVHELARR